MASGSRPHNIQASGDLDALRLLIETAEANLLPDEYEAKVTIGFMRGLFEQFEAAQKIISDAAVELGNYGRLTDHAAGHALLDYFNRRGD